jgi:mannose-1-phosphate guanylyltransferase
MSSNTRTFAVILAGGSGTRFWPASRRLRPKQLLPLGPAAPHSLISSTVRRLFGLVEPSDVLIATGRHLVEATRAELPELSEDAFLAEPCARNTAPCIAWAAAVVAGKDPDAIVCVLPSDQHAEDGSEFVRILKKAGDAARKGVITTIGIIPTRPETGYGYIQRGNESSEGVFDVARFVEKPDKETATRYIESGDYLWNAGIFVFRAGDMLAAIERHLPQMAEELRELRGALGGEGEKAAIERFFADCEAVSIDYGVMEKESKLQVVPGSFGWSDLGSWESAWELSRKDASGNAAPDSAILVDAKDNLVEDLRSDSSSRRKVIALVGVEGLCIVETDDALLVMPRERAQDVREVVQALKDSGRGDLI